MAGSTLNAMKWSVKLSPNKNLAPTSAKSRHLLIRSPAASKNHSPGRVRSTNRAMATCNSSPQATGFHWMARRFVEHTYAMSMLNARPPNASSRRGCFTAENTVTTAATQKTASITAPQTYNCFARYHRWNGRILHQLSQNVAVSFHNTTNNVRMTSNRARLQSRMTAHRRYAKYATPSDTWTKIHMDFLVTWQRTSLVRLSGPGCPPQCSTVPLFSSSSRGWQSAPLNSPKSA
mmetsp:Transcript_53503/g.88126  ORF Transcript_53503/g.88126 Transcript_53503/m.88126 type:complete len:234 (+) Transcript_53503:2142-2843(+)